MISRWLAISSCCSAWRIVCDSAKQGWWSSSIFTPMIDPGGRGLDQLQPRRTGQQLRVREPAAGVLGVARRLVMGQKRRDVGKLLQGGADIAGEIRVVTIHNDSDIRHRR